jgi:hypothetical protein
MSLWPPHSPDITLWKLFLWAYLKESQTNQHMEEEQIEVSHISREQL